MDKVYNHKDVEEKIYKVWEEKGYFKPEINPKGKPYSIILPPTNANGALHFGHAMYVVEDILIRFHRMKGLSALWLPGTDHAGIETQFVFEKKLRSEGKSRLDFKPEELFEMIKKYVNENRGGIEGQLRRLGFSLDWTREKYTLDQDVVAIVYDTFKKLFDDKLVYRAERLVNYCTFDGTSFSDLEVLSEEKEGSIYYIKYPLKHGGFITVATTRPETMFGDTAVMVNPEDGRYKNLIGKTVIVPLIDREVSVIADSVVDMSFGTGAVKVTPAHDFNDFEVGKRSKLLSIQVIGFNGQMQNTKIIDGLYPKPARKETLRLLEEKGLLEKTMPHKLIAKICYKCKNPIEPLPLEQWFVKMEPLAKEAIGAVKLGKIKIYPNTFEKRYFQFLENIRDWNISRQIVWGIQIPAWKCSRCREWVVTQGKPPQECKCGSKDLVRDHDTFDTWFSSGQWPYATLKTTNNLKFYPTDVMETGYDILPWWVARMAMLGIYIQKKQGVKRIEKQIPFKSVLLHGLVNDPYGKKMSKSKGNVVNPLKLVDQYGADAVRFALIYGNATGNDQALSYPKLDASRKFTNKLWNMARFIEMKNVSGIKYQVSSIEELKKNVKNENDKKMIKKIEDLIGKVTTDLEKYNFNYAAEGLYEFIWHEFADKYIEDVKNRINPESYLILNTLYLILLKLLHPFMPFVTEEIYRRLGFGKSIMIDNWPACHAS